MPNLIKSVLIKCLLAAALTLATHAQPTFRVTIRPEATDEPATGRLVVYLLRDDARLSPTAVPADAPFFSDPQPMVGLDVIDAAVGQDIIVSDDTIDAAFPGPLATLAPGRYTAQAVLDQHQANSNWRREPGNLFSDPVAFTITTRNPDPVIDIRLEGVVREPLLRPGPGLEFFAAQSLSLSKHRREPTALRAGVVFPADHDPERQYPAVYQIPGFGGDHFAAFRAADTRTAGTPDQRALHQHAFWIVLDPEGPNGHHLFANSDNNGPVADALINDLIPALEQRYNLIPQPSARLLRGHSSGAWSALWLATQYPETFGACWATAPDPVDFSRFQSADLYEDDNLYSDTEGDPRPSYELADGTVTMTIADENQMEQVLGPNNTSAQQWDSWLATFGPRASSGNPADLYNPTTGEINPRVADRWRRYDIHERLRRDRATVGRTFLSRIRLVVGDQDNFDLHRAVSELRKTVASLKFYTLPEGRHGLIEIVPGADHGSVLRSDAVRDFPRDMLDHLQRHNHAP